MQKKIKANLLETGLYFQKDPDKRRIKNMADNFDWNLVEPLNVSYRDGHYNVIDGQHRLFATRKIYGLDTDRRMPCNVIEGLTAEQECEYFVKFIQERSKKTPMQIYKGKYADGNGSEDIVDMYNKINNNGLILDFESGRKIGRVVAITTIYNIYKELNKLGIFSEYIEILSKTWNGDIKSLQAPVLNGVSEFIKRYYGDYDKNIFIRKLEKISPDDIIKEGKGDILDTLKIGCGKSIFNKYNKGLKEKTRLESKW